MKALTLFRVTVLVLCISLCCTFAIAQEVAEKDTNPTLFDQLYAHPDHTPTMKLHTAVKELFKNKSITQEYYIPGKMSISTADGEELEFTAETKIRGNTRKKVCDNAPIKIKLDKAQLTALGINADVNKLKLVLQCENHPRNFQQLLKEKLIYDLYEIVDPANHMLVKLIKLEMYEDGEMKENLNAYLVEDEESYAYRMNARVLETGRINYGNLPRPEYFRLCFFQYMIGNCDWSIGNKHNIELVKLPDAKDLVSVPYDFDYAGLVNNSYAVPPEQLPIESVTQRYFLIQAEMNKEEVDVVIDFYESKKDDFLATIQSQPFLDDKSKKSVTSYIESFYKTLSNRGRVLKSVQPRKR